MIVAAHVVRHDHHGVAFHALERTLEVEERIILPMPSLVKAYSVLTRFPAPYRLSPSDAFRVLKNSLQGVSQIAALSDQEAWPFFADLSRNQFTGRDTYDSQIIACAVKAGAKRILTLNSRDFQRLKPEGVEIVNPRLTSS
ncbi:MAG TPA: PIN domain-containing protein [Thermoanaerobaculia bacterium]|nr:PIN domain-containing protein [Thermoanaerobaculia bacterium]